MVIARRYVRSAPLRYVGPPQDFDADAPAPNRHRGVAVSITHKRGRACLALRAKGGAVSGAAVRPLENPPLARDVFVAIRRGSGTRPAVAAMLRALREAADAYPRRVAAVGAEAAR
jgi:hypothetical protein